MHNNNNNNLLVGLCILFYIKDLLQCIEHKPKMATIMFTYLLLGIPDDEV